MCVWELLWPPWVLELCPSEQVLAFPGSLSRIGVWVVQALGHWGDRARQPPAAWLPQKQHSE